MAYYPLFFNLADRPVLIIGGGKTAWEKAERLQAYGPQIKVVAGQVKDELYTLDGIRIEKRNWREDDLDGQFLVIAATDSKDENEKIARACKSRRILVNAVDDAQNSSCIFGAVIHQDDLSVGISTSGASPSAAVYLKKRIAKDIPENFDEILEWLGSLRPDIIKNFPKEKRSRLFHALFNACMEQKRALTQEEYERIVDHETGNQN